jgi:hypothetical protein
MPDINKFYLFCMGEGYLDKRRYQEEVGHEKSINRVLRDTQEATVRFETRQLSEPRLSIPLPSLVNKFFQATQEVVQAFIKPFQTAFSFFRSLFQQEKPEKPVPFFFGNPFKGPILERVISQIFTFFFGDKKDKTEEKEKRNKEDYSQSDVFGKRVVEESNGSGFSSGQR